MLPIERQQQILTWLEQEGTLRVSDISQRLDVSEMTVYRDLKPLFEQQKALKTSNGISLLPHSNLSSIGCTYCFKHSTTRFSVQLIKKNHHVEHTCCPHCGLLRYQDIENEILHIICHDFLKDTTISAKMATFLLGADIDLNCCQPQVIAFESITQAKQFQTGFGGRLYGFGEIIQAIHDEMNGRSCCHSEK